jgi:hypothetical protein
MNRKQMMACIEQYYKSIERTTPPRFRSYSNLELKKVILMFDIKINDS